MKSNILLPAGLALAGALAFQPLNAAIKAGDYLNGQWGSVDGGNRGATLTYVPNPDGSGTLFGLVFGYQQDGQNVWLQVQADLLENQFRGSGEIRLFEGGNFGFPPVSASSQPIGTFDVTLNSCGSIEYSFDFDSETGFEDTTWELESLIERNNAGEFPQCVYTQEFAGCPEFATTISESDRVCQISGQFLDQDITLTNETTWLLSGTVEFGGDNQNSSSLTIEPGTTLIGSGETDDFIWVARGSRIYADGLPNAPIVLTSPFDGFIEGETPFPGDVGGLAVAGNAQCNSADANGDCFSEFARGDQILPYGGDENDDSSGSVSYFQIRYAGIVVADNQEINAFTFLGVGDGTNISNIQAYQGSDDGIEFFGGTANARYVVFTAGEDDSIDWDEGWSGRIQYGLVAYGNADGDHGIEAANNPDNDDALPRATPVLSNITFIGSAGTGEGIRFKEGTAGQIWNSVVTNFDSSCLHITDGPTYTAAGSPDAPTGITAFAGNVIGGCGTADNNQRTFRQDDDAPWNVADFYNAFPNNLVGDPMLDGFQPMPGSPALGNGLRVVDLDSGQPDLFFNNTTFSGGFDGERDWTQGWTFDPLGVLVGQ